MTASLRPGYAGSPPGQGRAVVKWAGGKRWLVPLVGQGVHDRIAQTGGWYVEPFLGGEAMAQVLVAVVLQGQEPGPSSNVHVARFACQ